MMKNLQNWAAGIITVLLVAYSPLAMAQTVEEAFTIIYRDGWWGQNSWGENSSGEGSTLTNTEAYRACLQQLLGDKNIQSVVDLGCGDWEFSQAINWDGIRYLGLDVVKSVIEKNQKKFTQPNISFIQIDGTQSPLPPADLLICKDVLQHLSNEDVWEIVNQFPKFKYCLITNDVDPDSLSSSNPQIPRGHLRPLDLTQPPFCLTGCKLLTYRAGLTVKQVVLFAREF